MLVVGDPGTGKSSFLEWFVSSSRFANSHNPTRYLLDLRKSVAATSSETFELELLVKLIEAVVLFLSEECDDPCNEIEVNPVSIDDARFSNRKLVKKLFERQESNRKLYLFIDDIDYVDEKYFKELFALIQPLLMNRNVCVILAARVPAANAILSERDYAISHFFDELTTVKLSHIHVQSLLETRLYSLLNGCENTLAGIAHALSELSSKVASSLKNFLESEGYDDSANAVDRSSQNNENSLPFTEKQLTYIQNISNGNIRDMIAISAAFCRYMADNLDKLNVDTEGAIIIGRDNLIEEYSLPAYARSGKMNVDDLHKRKSYDGVSKAQRQRMNLSPEKIGNSLHVLLLEQIVDYGAVNATVMKHMKSFGFENDEVNEGVADLHRLKMIERRYIGIRNALGETGPEISAFELTSRGNYYLSYMIHWDEYIDQFGSSRHHISGIHPSVKQFLRRGLLQFLVGICITAKVAKKNHRFKISKSVFLSKFNELGRELLIWANWSDKATPLKIDVQRVTSELIDLQVAREHGVDSNRCFLIDVDDVQKACNKNTVKWEIVVPFFEEDLIDFVEGAVIELARDS